MLKYWREEKRPAIAQRASPIYSIRKNAKIQLWGSGCCQSCRQSHIATISKSHCWRLGSNLKRRRFFCQSYRPLRSGLRRCEAIESSLSLKLRNHVRGPHICAGAVVVSSFFIVNILYTHVLFLLRSESKPSG